MGKNDGVNSYIYFFLWIFSYFPVLYLSEKDRYSFRISRVNNIENPCKLKNRRIFIAFHFQKERLCLFVANMLENTFASKDQYVHRIVEYKKGK